MFSVHINLLDSEQFRLYLICSFINMIDTYILYIIIFLLSVVQSVAGVGLLVIGTPLFLLFGYNIIEIMFYLLPLSIITSIISLFFIKLKKKVEIKFKKKLFHYFLQYASRPWLLV